MTVCSYHVTYAFQSESTPNSFQNVKELLAWNRHDIWSLSNCSGTRTHNHLARKRTLDHLAKLAKFDFFPRTYMVSVNICSSSCAVESKYLVPATVLILWYRIFHQRNVVCMKNNMHQNNTYIFDEFLWALCFQMKRAKKILEEEI